VDTSRDISSPAYFESTFRVDAATAAELSRQAQTASAHRGGGLAPAPPPGVVPSATPSPSPSLSAQAEWQKLMADRSSGAINDSQWSSYGRAREQELANLIASGKGSELPTSLAKPPDRQAFSDAGRAHDLNPLNAHLDSVFAAPLDASEYRFPAADKEPTDEQIQSDMTLKSALHAEGLPKSMVENIALNLRNSARALANETPAQEQMRIADNRSRLTAMWLRSGEGTFEENMALVDSELERVSANPALKPIVEAAARYFTPLDIDSLFQYAKYRASRQG